MLANLFHIFKDIFALSKTKGIRFLLLRNYFELTFCLRTVALPKWSIVPQIKRNKNRLAGFPYARRKNASEEVSTKPANIKAGLYSKLNLAHVLTF